MKRLFSISVAAGILSVTVIPVKAQTNVNIERFSGSVRAKKSPKFIESIEIVRGATTSTISTEEKKSSQPEAVTKLSVVKPGFAGNIEHCTSLQFKYAMLMDREVESITNFSLYKFIEDWWATRYKYGGSDREGIDCSAFTGKLLSEVYGLTVPRTSKDQFALCEKLATGDLLEGDLVFFQIQGGINHVGLYLGKHYFAHSSVGGGVTISSLTDDYYSKKFISGGRIPRSPAAEIVNQL
ncbi:MAG: C40 family peptidase [Ferruginibacter sp.]|nr:C40 family peptidase [Ferruginibacter sp.]